MKTAKFLMDMYSDDFYTGMVDYVYDNTTMDIAEGMMVILMGGEI